MKKYIILFIVLFTTGAALQAQVYKVIINESNSTGSLSRKEASDYFLKKKTKWADGKTVMPIDLKASSPSRTAFSKEVHKKSVNAVKTYWQQSVFAGKATPPSVKNSDKEVIDYIKEHAGAIGYVSASSDLSGVKVITISD